MTSHISICGSRRRGANVWAMRQAGRQSHPREASKVLHHVAIPLDAAHNITRMQLKISPSIQFHLPKYSKQTISCETVEDAPVTRSQTRSPEASRVRQTAETCPSLFSPLLLRPYICIQSSQMKQKPQRMAPQPVNMSYMAQVLICDAQERQNT